MLSKPFHPPAKKRLLLYDVIDVDEGEIESTSSTKFRSATRSTVAATQFSIRDVVEGDSETDEGESETDEDTKAARKFLQNIKPGQFDFKVA